MQDELYEAIFRRKSVRKYDPRPLNEETLAKIGSFMTELKPLFPGIRTELRIIAGDKVRGMFKVDAPHFLAFFSEVREGYLSNAGFMLQQMDLFLSTNNLGSCWQGGPKPIRKAREGNELEFVILLAFGRPAEDPHRRSASEFMREPLSKITDIRGSEELLETARLAPSGMNNQPWYFIGMNGHIDAYSKKSLVVDRMNRISVGIALCHLWLSSIHSGRKVGFKENKSQERTTLKGYSYVASLVIG